MTNWPQDQERNLEIYHCRKDEGVTLRAIGKKFGLHPERVRQIVNRVVSEMKRAEMKKPVQLSRRGFLESKIADVFDSSARVAGVLKNDDIKFVHQLLDIPESELIRIPNFGRTSLGEVKEWLAEHGLYLGMTREEISEWAEEPMTVSNEGIPTTDLAKPAAERRAPTDAAATWFRLADGSFLNPAWCERICRDETGWVAITAWNRTAHRIACEREEKDAADDVR